MDMSWISYFKENTGWGKKLSFEIRKEIYEFFFKKIESLGYPLHKVSVCKETTNMLNQLKLNSTPRICYCYGKNAFYSH